MEVIRKMTTEIRLAGEEVIMLRRVAALVNARFPDGTDPALRRFVDELLEATRRE